MQFSNLRGVEKLPLQRQKRVARYALQEDKKRCLVAGLILNYRFGENTKLLETDEFGKLYMPNEELQFSISHSGKYVVFVEDKQEIGIDIQEMRDFQNDIIRKCFTQDEIVYFNSELDKKSIFFQVWTGKECLMKAIGKGFKIDPTSFSLMPLKREKKQIFGKDWYFKWIQIQNYMLCIATKEKKDYELHFLTKNDLL